MGTAIATGKVRTLCLASNVGALLVCKLAVEQTNIRHP